MGADLLAVAGVVTHINAAGWSRMRLQGLKIDFVRAERSSFRWEGEDEALIKHHGHRVHLLRDSGHWVHTDNLEGLVQILKPTFMMNA